MKKINPELNNISDWLKLNKMSLNAGKSKFMTFHMPQKHIKCQQIKIDQVKDFNFMEIVIDENIN